MKLVCKQCGKEFELSQSEIDFYKSKNLHIPKRCKECRQANKQKKGGKTHSYESAGMDTQNKYQALFNRNSARNSKLICAVLIIAIFLAVGEIVFTHIDSIGKYLGTTESVYDRQALVSEQIYNETKPVSETADNDMVVPLETIQSEPETPLEAIQSEPENFPETSVGTAQTDTDELPLQEPENVSAAPRYKFRNSELLSEHFEKHGIEMGFATKEEYQAAASAVVTNETALHKIEAEDGDDVYYLEESNEFVIVSTDGFIRTYFKPDNGIEYYNRQ